MKHAKRKETNDPKSKKNKKGKEKSTGDLGILVTNWLSVWLPKNKDKIFNSGQRKSHFAFKRTKVKLKA